jgi:hypothetical protein
MDPSGIPGEPSLIVLKARLFVNEAPRSKLRGILAKANEPGCPGPYDTLRL